MTKRGIQVPSINMQTANVESKPFPGNLIYAINFFQNIANKFANTILTWLM